MTGTVIKPCPTHVLHERRGGGKIIEYCEQGKEGHWGTCIGMKPEWQYLQELDAWKAQRAAQREAVE